MLRQYHSELGETRKNEMTARKNYFINKWAVRTSQELKGRGIKFFEVGEDGRKIYYCTDKAFEALCNKYDIDQELLLN